MDGDVLKCRIRKKMPSADAKSGVQGSPGCEGKRGGNVESCHTGDS